jgi:dihydroorotate dehydrogenase
MRKNPNIDLSVDLNGKITLKNPFILGSFDSLDCFKGLEFAFQSSGGNFSALVTKTTTVQRREGYPDPKIANFGDGFLVASGIANSGIETMSKEIKEFKKKYPDQIIFGSITSMDSLDVIEELKHLALSMAEAGVEGVELNLSCPHSDEKEKFKTCLIAQNPALIKKIVTQLKSFLALSGYSKVAIIPKLTGWGCNIGEVSMAAEEGGADAVVISNIFPGTGFYTGIRKIDNGYYYKIGQNLVGNKKGGYTGKALHSSVLLMVSDARRLLKIPIIATGGCATDMDSVVQTYFAGANAIEAVTPFYFDKQKSDGAYRLKKVSSYITKLRVYMQKNNFKNLNDFYRKF